MNGKQRTTEQLLEKTPRKHLPIYAFFAGSAISYVGDMLTFLAIPWFVLQTTGSVTQTGITAFFSTLPTVFSAFFGSTLVDRLGYKRTSVLGDMASGITIALIPLLYHAAGLAFWQLLALVFLGGLLKSPGVTARYSMVPDLAATAAMPLERANALSDGVSRISRFIGAPLAGVLIAVIGTSNLLWLDAASFALSALLIGLAVPATAPLFRAERATRSYLATVWEGVRFIQRDSLIGAIVLTVMITNLVDAAWSSVVGPAYIKSIFHSAIPFGLMIAALGGAAFVGTLIFGAIGHRLPRRLTFGIGYTLGGSLRFWVFLVPILPVLIGWQVIAGLAIAPINPLSDTVIQEHAPAEMRARVFGTINAGVLAGIPLGTFASGYLVAWLGFRMTLLVMGALYFVTTFSLLVNPALKKMEKPIS
ncbi:MAG TPA: MFS transporter [Ktedonobacteraceae bacterium]|nr:MFS transporter [Ktedonobacteraceae bacterium]